MGQTKKINKLNKTKKSILGKINEKKMYKKGNKSETKHVGKATVF